MLVNFQKFNYRSWGVCFILLTTLTLASCGKKAEDTAETTTTSGSSTAQVTGSTTAKEGAASKSAGGAILSAEARKLGVKPATATTCPPNAPIKGHINKKNNKKIYHEAKETGFDKIKPELCFADAAKARKAGFVARKASAPKATKSP